MATTFLTKTLSGSPTDNNKWTFSCWFKISNLANTNTLIYSNDGGTTWVTEVAISDAGKMVFQNKTSGGTTMNLTTNRLFRDTSAWYHVVAVFDSSNSTEADRQIIYINGVRETSFATNNPASLNEASTINDGYVLKIGKGNTSEYHDGLMSHVNFADGQALAPTVFGETDSTSGIWTIKTAPSLTYGTNGFFILKDGNTITDSSPNSNNFTLAGGTLTKTEDCPDNNFSTLNPLATSSYGTLTKGNNTVSGNSASNSAETFSTFSTNNNGKWYYEIKCIGQNGVGNPTIGFIHTARGFRLQNGEPGLGGATNGSLDIRVQPDGKTFDNGAASGSAVISTYTAGDILGFAIDSDNGAFYVSKNGVWQTSGNPESGASRTGAIKTWSPTDSKVTEGQSVCIGVYNTATVADANFGNGHFGTTAVTTNSGNGYAGTEGSSIFNYQPPTGYSALSTKGLNL